MIHSLTKADKTRNYAWFENYIGDMIDIYLYALNITFIVIIIIKYKFKFWAKCNKLPTIFQANGLCRSIVKSVWNNFIHLEFKYIQCENGKTSKRMQLNELSMILLTPCVSELCFFSAWHVQRHVYMLMQAYICILLVCVQANTHRTPNIFNKTHSILMFVIFRSAALRGTPWLTNENHLWMDENEQI